MARPREDHKKADLAERVVTALEREGLGISNERLATLVGVKRPTLLYHFPTAGDAVRTVLASLLAEQAAFVAERVERHEHPIDRLDARLRAIGEFHRGREARVLFLSTAVAALGGAEAMKIVSQASAFFDADRRAMVQRIERGIADGIVAPCDAKALVSTLRALVDGLTIQRVASRDDLGPVYDLVWERILLPLKRTPRKKGKPS